MIHAASPAEMFWHEKNWVYCCSRLLHSLSKAASFFAAFDMYFLTYHIDSVDEAISTFTQGMLGAPVETLLLAAPKSAGFESFVGRSIVEMLGESGESAPVPPGTKREEHSVALFASPPSSAVKRCLSASLKVRHLSLSAKNTPHLPNLLCRAPFAREPVTSLTAAVSCRQETSASSAHAVMVMDMDIG